MVEYLADAFGAVFFEAENDSAAVAAHPGRAVWRIERRRLFTRAVAVSERAMGQDYLPGMDLGILLRVPEWLAVREQQLDEQAERDRFQAERERVQAEARAAEALDAYGWQRVNAAAAHSRDLASRLREQARQAFRRLGQDASANPVDVANRAAKLLEAAAAHDRAADLANKVLES
jgi:hypothetical protein